MVVPQIVCYLFLLSNFCQTFFIEDLPNALDSEFSKVEKLIKKAVIDQFKFDNLGIKITKNEIPLMTPSIGVTQTTSKSEINDNDKAKNRKNESSVIDKLIELKRFIKKSLGLDNVLNDNDKAKNNEKESRVIAKLNALKKHIKRRLGNKESKKPGRRKSLRRARDSKKNIKKIKAPRNHTKSRKKKDLLWHFDKLGPNDIVNNKMLEKIEDNLTHGVYEKNKTSVIKKTSLGKRNRRIYRGLKTDIERFPFVASISIDDEFRCAGSIIHPEFLLTAASCLSSVYGKLALRTPVDLIVRVGSNYHDEGGQEVRMSKIYVHPNYNDKTFQNNVAVLRFKDKLKFKNTIRSIAYDQSREFDFHRIDLLAWAAREAYPSLSEYMEERKNYFKAKLAKAVLDKMYIESCQVIYSKTQVTDNNFCAGSMSHGSGACNYDIGAPALLDNKLVGIVSMAYPLCNQPGAPTVFTKIHPYSSWIQDVIAEKPITAITTTATQRNILRGAREYSIESNSIEEEETDSRDDSIDPKEQQPVALNTRTKKLKSLTGVRQPNYTKNRHERKPTVAYTVTEQEITNESLYDDEESSKATIAEENTNYSYIDDYNISEEEEGISNKYNTNQATDNSDKSIAEDEKNKDYTVQDESVNESQDEENTLSSEPKEDKSRSTARENKDISKESNADDEVIESYSEKENGKKFFIKKKKNNYKNNNRHKHLVAEDVKAIKSNAKKKIGKKKDAIRTDKKKNYKKLKEKKQSLPEDEVNKNESYEEQIQKEKSTSKSMKKKHKNKYNAKLQLVTKDELNEYESYDQKDEEKKPIKTVKKKQKNKPHVNLELNTEDEVNEIESDAEVFKKENNKKSVESSLENYSKSETNHEKSAKSIEKVLKKVKKIEKNLFEKYIIGEINEKDVINLIKPHWEDKQFYYLLLDALSRRLKMEEYINTQQSDIEPDQSEYNEITTTSYRKKKGTDAFFDSKWDTIDYKKEKEGSESGKNKENNDYYEYYDNNSKEGPKAENKDVTQFNSLYDELGGETK